MCRIGIQGRDVAQVGTPGAAEQFTATDIDFLQRFQAVSGEAGTDHVDDLD